MELCKKALQFFDTIEEQRQLQSHEFRLRLKIREMAFELATNIETKWKQRSRCRWLQQGDRNSRYFHAIASSRLRRNMILSLEDNGNQITDQNTIREIFLQSMKEIMGSSSDVLQFDPSILYPSNPNLEHLQTPFSLREIEEVVTQLANGKASGPDGLPNEFLKVYCQETKDEIHRIFQTFYHGNINLAPYNEAKIVLVPKKETPTTTGDFRPISVLNLIPKLIAKVLSNRLRGVLPNLISCNQIAFIHGRQIAENFVTTRELLNHISHDGKSAIFAKIDFKKASTL